MVQKTKKVYLHICAAIKNHITREYLKKGRKLTILLVKRAEYLFLQHIIPITSHMHR